MQEYQEFQKLTEALRRHRVRMAPEAREKLRTHLMGQLKERPVAPEAGFSFAEMITRVKYVAAQTFPSPFFMARLRERLMAISPLREKRPAFSFSLGAFGAIGRMFRPYAMKSVMAVLVLLLFVGGLMVDAAPVKASSLAVLVEWSAGTKVLRDGEPVEPQVNTDGGFSLQQGDHVFTGNGGHATVRFVDDSVARLGPSSEVALESLFVDPSQGGKTQVGLMLKSGKVWSRVVSPADRQSLFEVRTPTVRAKVKKGAAFSLEFRDEGGVSVQAVENSVDVAFVEDAILQEKTLVRGFELQVGYESATLARFSVSETRAKDAWVASNLASDHQAQALESLSAQKGAGDERFAADVVGSATDRVIAVQRLFADESAENKDAMVQEQVALMTAEMKQWNFAEQEDSGDVPEDRVEQVVELVKAVQALKHQVNEDQVNEGEDPGKKEELASAISEVEKTAFFSLGESLLSLDRRESDSLKKAEAVSAVSSLDIVGQKITDIEFRDNGVRISGTFDVMGSKSEQVKVSPDSVLVRNVEKNNAGETLMTVQEGQNLQDAEKALAKFTRPSVTQPLAVSGGASSEDEEVVRPSGEEAPETTRAVIRNIVVHPTDQQATAALSGGDSGEGKAVDIPRWIGF